jgi:hypothetical protein
MIADRSIQHVVLKIQALILLRVFGQKVWGIRQVGSLLL